MGLNLMSACHLHKTKVFHFRKKESDTMMPFYYKHADCMEKNPDNVETLDDQYQEQDWMADYPEGYKDEWPIIETKRKIRYNFNAKDKTKDHASK